MGLRQHVLRWLGPAVLLTLVFACSTNAPDEAALYLESASFRQEALVESLVNPANSYSTLRLENYEAWNALAEWNPSVRPLMESDIGGFAGDENRVTTDGAPFFDREAFVPSHESWLALGRRAFEEYPMGVDPRLGSTTHRAENAAGVGLWVDGRGRLGGLVRVQVTPEREAFAPTCATCHARVDGMEEGELVHGAANVDYDYGAIGMGGAIIGSQWGAGRLDVTGDGSENPVAISDLRPIRLHPRLHRAATVRNTRLALALRIETLLITSYDEQVRPPREIAYALAYYLWNMASEPSPDDTLRGAGIFQDQCASCHGVGRPREDAVDLREVGTDSRVGESSERGTGQYRVPSLYGVLDRPALLNRGERITVRELLSSENIELGHRYGRSLSDAEKDAIVEYLASW